MDFQEIEVLGIRAYFPNIYILCFQPPQLPPAFMSSKGFYLDILKDKAKYRMHCVGLLFLRSDTVYDFKKTNRFLLNI